MLFGPPEPAGGPALLNPQLYAACAAAFADVRPLRPGEPLQGYYRRDPYTGTERLEVVYWGEMVRASCPFCGDTRGRMAVSHRYGVVDERTGDRGFGMWRCYNEECQADFGNGRRLWEVLTFPAARARPTGQLPPTAPVGIKIVPGGQLPPVEFPGVFVSAADLPRDHPAALYLTGRGFDVAELAAAWGVGYAEHIPPRAVGAMAQGRVIAPVTQGGVQVGWQARYPGDLDWKATRTPKYLHFFPKTLAVYGIDQAAGADRYVLVEGVTDVWRYGPGAVCGFGKGLSPAQAAILAKQGGGRPLVLVPDQNDPGSEPAFVQAAGRLADAGYGGPVGIAALPPGRDPASLPRAALHTFVDRALAGAARLV